MTSGRKREFDSEVALDAAMHTFWQKGYVGTSMSDLIESMGINKPSMYRAFGNKEALFVKATQRYIETQMKPHLAMLDEDSMSLRERLKKHMINMENYRGQRCLKKRLPWLKMVLWYRHA